MREKEEEGMARNTVADIWQTKRDGKKMVMAICYYHEMARIIDRAGPEMMLVGDSGSGFLLGHPETNDTTVEDMIVMGRAVTRGSQQALVTVDMPFMSYQASVEDAIRNAGRIVKETRCNAVKLEGGEEFAPHVAAIVRVGIPVMAHYGLTPQTTAAMGGMRGGASLPEEVVWRNVRALQDAGAFSIVLTGIRPPQTEHITKELRIPTIAGYLAGDECDVVLLWPATLGYGYGQVDNATAPYGALGKAMFLAAQAYIEDCRAGQRKQPIRAMTA
jgi:3-methyl-2-oxobutanoate hydroxymethyltransferase